MNENLFVSNTISHREHDRTIVGSGANMRNYSSVKD